MTSPIDRRSALALMGAGLFAPAVLTQQQLIRRRIPSSGEAIPAIGMGTWITFNVGESATLRRARTDVLRAFLAQGGRMIDSSPMYGSSQEVIGFALRTLRTPRNGFFAADKIWTNDGDDTRKDAARSRARWGIDRFDLLAVHNLVSWEEHLAALLRMKEAGEVRYVGVTTSHGRRHSELERIMRTQPIDFVQLTYNVQETEAERRLLPLAQERRIGVVVNRPFEGGELLGRLARHPLPAFARDIDCTSWSQLLLKFIISHPAVTCAIPATSRVDHMNENMAALRGRLPDAALRARLQKHVAAL